MLEKWDDSLVRKVLFAGGETVNAMKFSYIEGLALGAIGRYTGAEWAPAVPVGMDVIGGFTPTSGRIACYVAYGAGVATIYADKVSSVFSDVISGF